MNRKPGVKVLIIQYSYCLFIEQFDYENSFEVLCMLEPICLSYVSIGYTKKTRDFDLRQGRAMARRKSGEAPWFSDNFCWPFWN